ncbi:unnamed protein product [Bemisia tabaci]|uniref:STAGA complex 65 subunit gamma n=1 Tax=Bemisia tabaci TaxID=7038 RepID=A0A9P0C9N4_BEMTA|nr:unnamed protein product [Bemisia tabaci]
MEASTSLWGTIPPIDTGDPQKALTELEMEVVMNALETEPHEPDIEDEKKNVPDHDNLQLVPVECSQMNPVILNTIKLIQYAKKVSELTDRIYAENKDLTIEIQNLNPIPPLLETKLTHLERPPDYESDFVLGIGSPPFHLNSRTRTRILHKCVATLAAHRGYDYSSSTAIEVLTSVAGDLITKICRRLRLNADKNLSPDNLFRLERVFHEMNIGPLRSLNHYYQTQVLDYQKSSRFQCEKLVEELNIANEAALTNLLKQEHISNGQSYEMEFKQDDDDIPLLHFPAEDGTENDGFQSSLEHGFQMLHNLEQEQLHLGNVDPEKDSNLIIHHQSLTKYIKRQ